MRYRVFTYMFNRTQQYSQYIVKLALSFHLLPFNPKQTLPEKAAMEEMIVPDNGALIKWPCSASVTVHSASTLAGPINHVSLAQTVQHVHYTQHLLIFSIFPPTANLRLMLIRKLARLFRTRLCVSGISNSFERTVILLIPGSAINQGGSAVRAAAPSGRKHIACVSTARFRAPPPLLPRGCRGCW